MNEPDRFITYKFKFQKLVTDSRGELRATCEALLLLLLRLPSLRLRFRFRDRGKLASLQVPIRRRHLAAGRRTLADAFVDTPCPWSPSEL